MTGNITRRTLLKTAAGVSLAAAGGVGSLVGPFSSKAEAAAPRRPRVRVDRWVPSVCPYCGAGCAILYGVRNGRIVRVKGDPEGWNRGSTCLKGPALADLFLPGSAGVRDRLLKPMLRDPGARGSLQGFREVSWDDALHYMVEKALDHTKLQVGNKSGFALYGSGQVLNEFEYLESKLALIGLNAHVDNNGRLCQATKAMAMVITYGVDGPPMSLDDVYHADNLLIVGFNIGETLPRWFADVVDAKNRRGADLKIAVINPVKISACRILDEATGDQWVPVMPGTDIALTNALAHVIVYELEGVNDRYGGDVDAWLADVRNGTVRPLHIDVDFIERYASFFRGEYGVLSRLGVEGPKIFQELAVGTGMEGFQAYARFLAKFTPESVASRVGVHADQIRALARLFVRGRNTMTMYLQGYGQYSNGVMKHNALSTLHVITGRIGRAGAGVMPTVGQPNGLGQRMAGAVVGRLPGNRNHPVPAHRASLAKALAPEDPEMEKMILDRIEDPATDHSRLALTAVDMFKKIQERAIRSLWVVCTNPMVSFPNLNAAMQALQQAEMVVVQDIYWSETAAFADVILPAASASGESVGTFFNTERRVQALDKAVDPPGDCLPDEVILLAFAYKYARALEREGRTQEARFMDFLVKPFVAGYEDLFTDVQANVRRLREVTPEIQARVFAELAAVSKGVPANDFSGLSYERLWRERDARGLKGFKTPVPTATHKGTDRLYDDAYEAAYGSRFATPDGRVRCFLCDDVPPAEEAGSEYPFLATLPRLYEHWHSRTRTGRCALPHKLRPEAWVSLNRADAARLGVKDGDRVEVASRRGSVVVPARVDELRMPREGVVWLPWSFGFLGDLFQGTDEAPPGIQATNVLANDAYDPVSKQPELKLAAVKIRRVM